MEQAEKIYTFVSKLIQPLTSNEDEEGNNVEICNKDEGSKNTENLPEVSEDKQEAEENR